MVNVGDQIRLSSGKGPDRGGVVTAVTGQMVRVRWPSGEETTVVPAPGTLSVVSSEAKAPAAPAAAKKAAPKKAAAAKKAAPAKKATGVKRPSR